MYTRNLKILYWLSVILFALFVWLATSLYTFKYCRGEEKEILNVEYDIDEGVDVSPQVFVEVRRIFAEAGVELNQFIQTDTFPDIFPQALSYTEGFYHYYFKESRNFLNAQHVIIGKDNVEPYIYALTISWSELGDTFTQEQLNSVGTTIFSGNIALWTENDSGDVIRGINWGDSVVSYDELLTKVIVHELGHQLGLGHSSNFKSVMHTGQELETIWGPEHTGPEFLKEDIENMKFNERLGIDRVKRI